MTTDYPPTTAQVNQRIPLGAEAAQAEAAAQRPLLEHAQETARTLQIELTLTLSLALTLALSTDPNLDPHQGAHAEHHPARRSLCRRGAARLRQSDGRGAAPRRADGKLVAC